MKLNSVVPWGRTLAEYQAMFCLSPTDLQKIILGCGDGPASFNAEMTALGHTVVSIDPLYEFSPHQIEQRVHATYEPIISQVRQNRDRYCWQTFQTAEELGKARLAAMGQFLADFETGKAAGRYISASLPTLPLADRTYDLCLCSHLLFLYSEQLSLTFHRAAIHEMLRVASEIRIFPLLQLDCAPSPYLAPILQELKAAGFSVHTQLAEYEFQQGGNQFLQISHAVSRTSH